MNEKALVFKVEFVNYDELEVFKKELEYFTNTKDLQTFLTYHQVNYNYRTGEFSYDVNDKIQLLGVSRIDGFPIFKLYPSDFEENILNALSLLNNKLTFKKFLRKEKVKAILNDTPIPKLINFGSGDIKIHYVSSLEDNLPRFKN